MLANMLMLGDGKLLLLSGTANFLCTSNLDLEMHPVSGFTFFDYILVSF